MPNRKMSRLFLYLFIIATLCVSLSFAKIHKMADQRRPAAVGGVVVDDETVAADNAAAQGALRVGTANVLVPDASAEHPMIISNPEDQPLCKPNQTIAPSRDIKVMEGYEFIVLANTISNPRKILIDPANHVLVASPGQGIYSIRMDECGNQEVQQILSNDKMDQPIADGFALYGQHLYVATANSVYQFPYSDGQHSPLLEGVKILSNINPEDPEASPDVAIDIFGHIFVPRSVSQIDDKMDHSRAVIKKFNLKLIPEHGFDYNNDGEVHAYGANTYGSLGFDTQARLWGINNLASSNIVRHDISSEHNLADAGIAEELNLYEFPKMNYGFPYCMTEFDLKDISASSKGMGAQWGYPAFMNDSFLLDDYCQEEDNNRRPAFPLAPNSVASSLHFYMGTFCSVGDLTTQGTSVGLPCNWTDTPIISNHGFSGQSEGHNVVRLHFDDLGHKPRWDQVPDVILEQAEPCAGTGCISPYGLAVDGFGRLFISSDETNEVFMVSRIYNEHAVKLLTDRDNAANGNSKTEEEGKDNSKPDEGNQEDNKNVDNDVGEGDKSKDTGTDETSDENKDKNDDSTSDKVNEKDDDKANDKFNDDDKVSNKDQDDDKVSNVDQDDDKVSNVDQDDDKATDRYNDGDNANEKENDNEYDIEDDTEN